MIEQEKNSIQDKRSQLSLKNLYLDPNNYRFIDAETYVQVTVDQTLHSEIQRRTTSLILGKNAENVRDLIESFRKNGFLPVDQIQVRRIEDTGKFLVVEGNRRIAALKYLQSRYDNDGIDLGKLDPDLFTKVPVVYYNDADEVHHMILMGLKHISGNKKWPAINQAELVRTLYDYHHLSTDDICKSIGITKQEVNATLQTLFLIDEYKRSEYGDQFASDKYSIFREIIRNRKLRSWIEWDEAERTARKRDNIERLFSWISEEALTDDETEEEFIGNHQKLEAILVKSSQIRDLAKIIDDEQALSNLDITRNLAEATLSSEVLGKDKVKNALSIIGQEVNAIFGMSKLIADSDRAEIKDLHDKLQSLISLGHTQSISTVSRPNYLTVNGEKFSSINIHSFRRLSNISLENIKKINIIAGINNSGKTTVLEAIKLLCSLNASNDFISLVRSRSKSREDKVDISWFVEQLPTFNLSAVYNGNDISFNANVEEQILEDTTQYLTSECFEVSYGNDRWSSQIHFFEKYPQRTEGRSTSICPSVFSTPFNTLEPDLLQDCHSKSLKEGSKQQIINFIREYIDTNIENIEMDEHGHFTVIHNRINPNPDLTKFGEGLQRIFKLGLLFAGAKNGVVIIDEFENAIHSTLLNKVAILLHELTNRFNVQVFICSHSKECIDSFANCHDIPKEDISAYGLVENEEGVICQYFSGARLHTLIENIDFDLRGGVKK